MMNFQEFKTEMACEMEKRLGEGRVMIEDVVRNNNVKLTALVIRQPQTNISPVIYLEKHYEELKNKKFSEVADEIWRLYQGSRVEHTVDLSFFTEWEFAKGRIAEKLVHYERNRERLKTVPFEKYLNLAVIYYYIVDTNEGRILSVTVDHCLMDIWGIHKEDLKKASYANYKKFYAVRAESIDLAIAGLMGITSDEFEDRFGSLRMPMYVVSNQMLPNGAAVMLYPEELKGLADQWEDDLYVLPSSVNEIIVLPAASYDMQSLKKTVSDVNAETVSVEDWLSDSVYYYSRKSGEISIALE